MNKMNQVVSAHPQWVDFSALFKNCSIQHHFFKRLFDIVFSCFVLILMSPILLFTVLGIFLTSRGKIVYAHERVGRGGTTFKCYKFRTMYTDADARLKELLKDPKLNEEWQTFRKLKNDPRVTPIGKFLRKTSLDEFPQFWNVLKGDMSVVGPRPVVKEEVVKHLGLKAPIILRLRPGITGLWQVSGRSDTSYESRVELDVKYVEQYSFFQDIWIVLKTIPAILASKGAY